MRSNRLFHSRGTQANGLAHIAIICRFRKSATDTQEGVVFPLSTRGSKAIAATSTIKFNSVTTQSLKEATDGLTKTEASEASPSRPCFSMGSLVSRTVHGQSVDCTNLDAGNSGHERVSWCVKENCFLQKVAIRCVIGINTDAHPSCLPMLIEARLSQIRVVTATLQPSRINV